MLKGLKGVLVGLRDLIWWKVALTFAGYFFAVLILLVDPSDIAPYPDEDGSYQASRVKAASFAFITAITLIATLIPTCTGERHKLVDGMARLLGALSALGAGWYVLDDATQGNPGLYLVGFITLAGLATILIAIAAGFYVAYSTALTALIGALNALYQPLRSIARFLYGRLRRRRVEGDCR